MELKTSLQLQKSFQDRPQQNEILVIEPTRRKFQSHGILKHKISHHTAEFWYCSTAFMQLHGVHFVHLAKKLPTFCGTRKVHYHAYKVRTRRLTPWAVWIQPTPSHPISLRSILMLLFSLGLGLGLPGCLFWLRFPTKFHVCFSSPQRGGCKRKSWCTGDYVSVFCPSPTEEVGVSAARVLGGGCSVRISAEIPATLT
jgi:hypothetical protein